MSIAEVWAKEAIEWYPVVIALLVAAGVCWWGKQYLMAGYILYIILGLPIFEIISVKTTGFTLSQHLAAWRYGSVRDYFLWWIWAFAMIDSMVLLAFHVSGKPRYIP